MIACEGGDDCPYNNWCHPQCMDDLKNKTQEEIEKLENWVCD